MKRFTARHKKNFKIITVSYPSMKQAKLHNPNCIDWEEVTNE